MNEGGGEGIELELGMSRGNLVKKFLNLNPFGTTKGGVKAVWLKVSMNATPYPWNNMKDKVLVMTKKLAKTGWSFKTPTNYGDGLDKPRKFQGRFVQYTLDTSPHVT